MKIKILEYKKLFKKQIKYKKDYTYKLNTLYTEILHLLIEKYKNTYNLLRSSLLFYLFLIPDNLLVKYNADQIKKLFYIETIINNSIDVKEDDSFIKEDEDTYEEISTKKYSMDSIFNFIDIKTNINLLEFHPLVLVNLKDKNIIIRKLLNKLAMALKLDIFGNKKLIDYYKEIEYSLEKKCENKNKNEIRNKTTRGGIKKKLKKIKKME